MKQLEKKKLKKRPDCGHYEGKFWCDCRTRNIRKYLGIKRYGKEFYTKDAFEEGRS